MSEQSNISTVLALFAALNKGDLTSAEAEFLHDDAAVHVPGKHPLARKHEGKQGVLDFYSSARTRTDEVSFEVESIAAAGEQVFVELRIQARRAGDSPTTIDTRGVNVITFADEKITEIRHYTSDQHTLDTYLTSAGA
jgi:ketosteroid isomerase-like protein